MVPHVSVFTANQRDAFSFKWQKHVLLLQPVIRTVVISSSSKTLNPSIAPVVLMLSQSGFILTCLLVCVCPRHHPTASSCPYLVTWNGWMEFHHACLAKQGFQSLFSKPVPSAIISSFIHHVHSFIHAFVILHHHRHHHHLPPSIVRQETPAWEKTKSDCLFFFKAAVLFNSHCSIFFQP